MSYTIKDEREYSFVWRNNGLLPTEEPGQVMKLTDALAIANAPMWLPKIFVNVVKEAAEPLLMGTSLLQRIEYNFGPTITFPAVGALDAADIAEGQSYPERALQMGGASVTALIGKSGLAIKITEEMINWSQYDVIGMHLRAAGRALARHKEKKIFNAIRSLGVVCFDNLTPLSSIFGVTHGRALDGSANGSVIMDDLIDIYGQILMQGFTPDTILVHPLTWAMFLKDPVLKVLAMHGVTSRMYGNYQGSAAGKAPWAPENKGLGRSPGLNVTPGSNAGSQTATPVEQWSQLMTSAPELPSYFPFPLRVLVSPFVRFNPSTKLTDIMMFDSQELGALVVAEDVVMDEWNDLSVDIRKIKMRERYGIGILNEGQGVGVLRNVKVVSNEIVLPAQARMDVSGSIGIIPPTTAVV